ncbi:MAG: serine hydrolase [Chloroflexota bacterium]
MMRTTARTITTLLAAVAIGGALAAPAAAFTPSPVTPERVAAAVAEADAIVADALARTGVPGLALAIVHDDTVVHLAGYGIRDLATGAPVTTGTVFQLASVSKPIGATVISAAVDRGLVRWDDPIVMHLPDFRLADPWVTDAVTIADMYSHRSGLPDHAAELPETWGFDQATVLAALALEPLAPFRATYAYTNTGLTAGGLAAAAAAGMDWAEMGQELLYGPAGMTETSSRFADYLAAPDRAVGHLPDGAGGWRPITPFDPDVESPAGGVSSSITDIATWLRLQLGLGTLDGREIVSAAALAEMRTPRIVPAPVVDPVDLPPVLAGLGINVMTDANGRPRLTHSGAFTHGVATTIVILPADGIAIGVLTNGAPLGVAEGVAEELIDRIVTGDSPDDRVEQVGAGFRPLIDALIAAPEEGTPARPLAAYTGTYRNAYLGAVTIAQDGDALIARVGPDGRAYPVVPLGGDTFVIVPPEPGEFVRRITFRAAADGTIDALELADFPDAARGLLLR